MTPALAAQLAPSPFRILVVEDEMVIALCIEQCLTAQGHEVVGPVARRDEALRYAAAPQFDFALLDVNLAGEQVYPVAATLTRKRIPFAFLSGHGARGVRPEWKHAAMLEKPFSCDALIALAGEARQQWHASRTDEVTA
ncbi:MAG: response regulator [Hyphomonadaceae bacterium]